MEVLSLRTKSINSDKSNPNSPEGKTGSLKSKIINKKVCVQGTPKQTKMLKEVFASISAWKILLRKQLAAAGFFLAVCS